jgi:2-polyprenyl-3-methyl-5-hydroxy-6-metoxy-1,4-benzoquinol methylase
MPTPYLRRANAEIRDAWNKNAAFWDERMGDGNEFVEILVWPATEQLLDLRAGERVLDIACGSGLSSRRLAAKGADVVAFDLAEEMIARARARSHPHAQRIEYLVLDTSDEAALLALGEQRFDASLCHMALFDMAELPPLMRAIYRLLRPGGRFVFSVLHPCFNSSQHALVAEMEETASGIVRRHAVKVFAYLQSRCSPAWALHDQPSPHPLYHRPLRDLFGAGFSVGLVLDGLEGCSFPATHPARRDSMSWGATLCEIPPVLVARLRRP